jgi:hypothetical protein
VQQQFRLEEVDVYSYCSGGGVTKSRLKLVKLIHLFMKFLHRYRNFENSILHIHAIFTVMLIKVENVCATKIMLENGFVDDNSPFTPG